MKHFYLLLALLLTSNLTGQTEYHFFQPEVQYLFENQSQFVNRTNSRLTGVKVGDAECNELYSTVVVEENTNPSFMDANVIVPSFAGLSICQTSDAIRMEVGKENDVVIRQHAGLGETWDVTVEDGFTVTGRVDSIRAVEIDGVIDSVKYLNFFKGDTLLLEAPVELSRSNGLRKAAYFWGLLSMRETLELEEEPVEIPTWETTHSFAVGDEFHVESVTTVADDSNFGYGFRFSQEIFRVLTVTDSSGYRIVIYGSDILKYSSPEYEDRSGATDSVLVVTRSIREVYKRNEPGWLNLQPGAIGWPGFSDYVNVVNVGGSCSGARKFMSYPILLVSLYGDAGNTTDASLGDIYYSGVGGPYFMHYNEDGTVEGRSLKHSNRCNSARYNEPFDFSGITDIDFVEAVPGVEVFPNPASETISIVSAVETVAAVALYDASGRRMLSRKTDLGAVDVRELPVGVYNLVISFRSGKKLNQRVVVSR